MSPRRANIPLKKSKNVSPSGWRCDRPTSSTGKHFTPGNIARDVSPSGVVGHDPDGETFLGCSPVGVVVGRGPAKSSPMRGLDGETFPTLSAAYVSPSGPWPRRGNIFLWVTPTGKHSGPPGGGKCPTAPTGEHMLSLAPTGKHVPGWKVARRRRTTASSGVRKRT